MSYYNVVQPCVIGNLHYVRPTTQPIELDDKTAKPLVSDGCLEAYQPGVLVAPASGLKLGFMDNFVDEGPISDSPAPKRRGRREPSSDDE